MDSTKLGSGDNRNTQSKSPHPQETKPGGVDDKPTKLLNNADSSNERGHEKVNSNEFTTQMIDENEAKLKERIAQCRNIIESLKVELTEEKAKLERDSKSSQLMMPVAKCTPGYQYASSDALMVDMGYSNIYSECVDNKLNCDENLMKYEKQLEKYQNTLNMAQIEKKNAIRKQMLAKAYRLKLMEVENQCNIELLRVKQNLQCLEPLQMIASKWKTSNEDTYDTNSFELIPRYPELNGASSTSAFSDFRDDIDIKSAIEKSPAKEDLTFE